MLTEWEINSMFSEQTPDSSFYHRSPLTLPLHSSWKTSVCRWSH